MTQRDLARALHISNSSVSAYERNERLPTIDVLVALADFFHVTTDYLTGRTEHNLLISIFSETYAANCSVGDLLNAMTTLSSEQRQALTVLVSDLQFAAEIRKRK